MHNAERAAQKHLQHKNVQHRNINNTQMCNPKTNTTQKVETEKQRKA